MLKKQHNHTKPQKAEPMLAIPLLLLTAAFTFPAGPRPAPPRTPAPSAGAAARELLTAARGAAPALCVLAANGIRSGGWGGTFDPPVAILGSTLPEGLRRLHRAPLSGADPRA